MAGHENAKGSFNVTNEELKNTRKSLTGATK